MVRYYIPFDKNHVLFYFIKNKINIGEIIIIDKVLKECSYIAKGIIMNKLTFLSDIKPYTTEYILAPSPIKFLRQIDNQFANKEIIKQRKISDEQYEIAKSSFLESADMKLIILCLNLNKDNSEKLLKSNIFLVTEESVNNNDNKLFKKIPFICKQLNISTMTLPELLNKYEEINIEFK